MRTPAAFIFYGTPGRACTWAWRIREVAMRNVAVALAVALVGAVPLDVYGQ
jgi:hypothetical protein